MLVSNITKAAPIGSTMPLRLPIAKDFLLEFPAARIGMEMIAPSGTFWIAIPRASVTAAAIDIFADPEMNPPTAAPTAIPSGKLCIVTARVSIAVFERWLLGPSSTPSG